MPTITRQVPLEEIPENWRDGLNARPNDRISVRLDVVSNVAANLRERVFEDIATLRKIGASAGSLSAIIKNDRETLENRNVSLNL